MLSTEWLHSSVGRTLQRHRRGPGFESRWIFQVSLTFRLNPSLKNYQLICYSTRRKPFRCIDNSHVQATKNVSILQRISKVCGNKLKPRQTRQQPENWYKKITWALLFCCIAITWLASTRTFLLQKITHNFKSTFRCSIRNSVVSLRCALVPSS